VVQKSGVTWATPVPILVFLGLSVLDIGPMYATDRRQTEKQTSDVRQKHRLMSPPIRGGGIKSTLSLLLLLLLVLKCASFTRTDSNRTPIGRWLSPAVVSDRPDTS